MSFSNFLSFDRASKSIFSTPKAQRQFRECLEYPYNFVKEHPEAISEAKGEKLDKTARKGVGVQYRSVDDAEHGILNKMADERWQQVRSDKKFDPKTFMLKKMLPGAAKGLGTTMWGQWPITKAALELGGVDMTTFNDLRAKDKFDIISKVDWDKVSPEALREKLIKDGVPILPHEEYKRQYGIQKLKRIQQAAKSGQPIADPREAEILKQWIDLENRLNSNPNTKIVGTNDPDVGIEHPDYDEMLPVYKQLTASNEQLEPVFRKIRNTIYENTNTNTNPNQIPTLSPDNAYDYLTKTGVEVISQEEAEKEFVQKILNDIYQDRLFTSETPQGSSGDKKRWLSAVKRNWGAGIAASQQYDPGSDPGFAQRIAGITTRGFKKHTSNGRVVPYDFGDPEPLNWKGDKNEMPDFKITASRLAKAQPNPKINAFYHNGTHEANSAFEDEMMFPARRVAQYFANKEWISQTDVDDFAQDIAMAMEDHTGAVPDWRSEDKKGFRFQTANYKARQLASKMWQRSNREKTNVGGKEDSKGKSMASAIDNATNQMHGGESLTISKDEKKEVQKLFQNAIKDITNIDKSVMRKDDEEWVDSLLQDLQSKNVKDVKMAIKGLIEIADQYESELPELRDAVHRVLGAASGIGHKPE